MKMNSENQMESVRCGGTGWGPGLIMTGVIALSACGGLNATSDGAPSGKVDAAAMDSASAIDGPAKTVCDPLAPFGPWVSLGDFQTQYVNVFGQPSADELSFYFRAAVSATDYNLYVSRRISRSALFGPPTLLVAQNTTSTEGAVSISADGLSLWFESDRSGVGAVYVASRASLLADFGAPGLATGINTVGNNVQPFIAADNSELWFTSDRSGNTEIWSAKASPSGFVSPTKVLALNSENTEWLPRLSADGLTAYFSSDRPGGKGDFDIWRSTRSTVNDGFSAPAVVTELNTAKSELVGGISADNCRIYALTSVAFSVATRQP
jgi:hypothetical protein